MAAHRHSAGVPGGGGGGALDDPQDPKSTVPKSTEFPGSLRVGTLRISSLPVAQAAADVPIRPMTACTAPAVRASGAGDAAGSRS